VGVVIAVDPILDGGDNRGNFGSVSANKNQCLLQRRRRWPHGEVDVKFSFRYP